jgi:hypothetical protein
MRSFCLALFLTLAACVGNGPIFPVDGELYDWVFAPEAVVPDSRQMPVIEGEAVTFRLAPGSRRSALKTGEDWRTGQTRLFGFDIKVDPAVLGRNKLEVSRLLRATDPVGEIVSVQLDAKNGLTVFGRTCVPPENLSQWHRVEMRIRLRDDDYGYLEVFCDRKPVWARTGMRTTVPPICKLSEGCNEVVSSPVRYEWQMGLFSEGVISGRPSVRMRRLHHRILLYIPNRAGNL